MTRQRVSIYLFLVFLFSGISDVIAADIDEKTKEILDIYSNAITSNDTNSILAAIEKIKEKSIDLQKPITSLPFNLSQLYFRAGRNSEAEKILREWDSTLATLYLGQYYIRIGEVEKAKTELRLHEVKIVNVLNTKRSLQGLQNLISIWTFLGDNIPANLNFWRNKWNFTDQEIMKAKEAPSIFEKKILEDMWERI